MTPFSKTLIYGDIGLDVFCEGSARGLTPERDMPLYKEHTRIAVPGLAANVANAAPGSHLFGTIGNDEAGTLLEEILERRVNLNLEKSASQTTVKTRLGQQIRWDQDYTVNPSSNTLQKLITASQRADSVVVSDYGKGAIVPGLIEALKAPVLVDPHPKSAISLYKGADILKLNGFELKSLGDQVHEIAKTVIVTNGADTVDVYKNGKLEFQVQPHTVGDVDVCGAGDIFIAHLAANYQIVPLVQAVQIAADRAALAIEEPHKTRYGYKKVK